MSGTYRFEGYAIVSADGMIADAAGVMPDSIRNDADQRYLQSALDRAAVLVHGRHSAEGGPRAASRRRLIATRTVTAVVPDPSQPNAFLWNPRGASVEDALAAANAAAGVVAVIGGTELFGLFLPLYDAFHLSRAANARIPGGRPVFPQEDAQMTPEDVLAARGLRPGSSRDLDAAAGITLTIWHR